jgi:two-component system sensor histidine kinase
MSWVLSLLLAAWAVLFYFTMIDEINDEVDDSLENYAEILVKRTLAGRELPAAFSGSNNGYFLHDVSPEYAGSHPAMVYSDEEIFIPEKDEDEPARVLRMIFQDRQGHYKELTVMTPTIEKEDLREAILWWIVTLYIFLLLTVLLINILVMHRTLRPLYALLQWLDGYTVGAKNAPLPGDTKIVEFRQLNEAIGRYTRRAELLFDRQKQFIGNASHEMQTPLAVCRNRLEMLVDDGSALNEEQLGEIMKVQQTLDYLVRLNRSLLLLSKIENGQFPETGLVDFNALIRQTADDLGEIYAGRGIHFKLCEEGQLTANMNPLLAASLVSNLLKNAYVHGDAGGEVTVMVTRNEMCVCNSSAHEALDADRIFERFNQGAKKEGSTGLGLSIADAICHVSGLRIAYTYLNNKHCFTVYFRK